jgi:hypothetical protein
MWIHHDILNNYEIIGIWIYSVYEFIVHIYEFILQDYDFIYIMSSHSCWLVVWIHVILNWNYELKYMNSQYELKFLHMNPYKKWIDKHTHSPYKFTYTYSHYEFILHISYYESVCFMILAKFNLWFSVNSWKFRIQNLMLWCSFLHYFKTSENSVCIGALICLLFLLAASIS